MPIANPTLLGATRGLLWLILGLVAAAALLVLVVSGALIAAWPEVLVEIKNSKSFIDAAAIRPLLGLLMVLLLTILAGAAYMLRQLQGLVASAATDPFIPANAGRLRHIGWALVVVQLVAIPLGWVARRIAEAGGDLHAMGGFSLGGVLAILLAFVLAAVFDQGAAMRDELEGTV